MSAGYVVPEEWVEAAAIARHEYRRRLSPLAISFGWYDLDPEDQGVMLGEARAALAAVIPLAVEAEAAEVAALQAEVARLREALSDARLQLEYMESRWPTGTTPTILVRINAALEPTL